MATRRLLYLDAHRLSAYVWRGGHLSAEGDFTADPPGLEAYGHYLARNRSSLFHLLCDVADEGYQIDDVPAVQGRDRSALIERRLGQYFYGTPLATAISLGRAASGRRDEKILFSALTRPQELTPWLEVMHSLEIQLAGIYSPALLAQHLLPPPPSKAPQLLLTLTRSGLRQTFFDAGQFRFSRLTPLATGSIEECALACAVETAKIHQYLVGQRMFERGSRLDVRMLVHPDQLGCFRDRCQNTSELNFEFTDILQLAQKNGLKTPLSDSNCEGLYLHQLIRTPPKQQFAPSAERRFYRLWQIRQVLYITGAALFLSCLVFSLKQMRDIHTMQAQTASLEHQARSDQQRYEAMLRTLPPMPTSVDNLRQLIGSYESLDSRSPPLSAAYQQLSQALNEIPQIELNSVEWAINDKNDPPPSGTDKAGLAKSPPISGAFFAIATVEAKLPASLANNHRAILDIVDTLIKQLSKHEGMELRILRMPFDTESSKTIKSSAESSTTEVEAPRFAFRIAQKIL